MKPTSPSLRAFTVLEVMLAIGIFSGLVVAMYASWSAVIRSAHRSTQAAIESHRVRTSLDAIDEAFKSAMIFESNQHLYSFLTLTEEDRFSSFSLSSHLSPRFPGSAMFPGQPLRRVSFSVEEKEEGSQLILLQQNILDPMEEGSVPYSLVLLENVSSFRLEFWDLGFDDWIGEWSSTNRFPAMVRYSLELENRSDRSPDSEASVRAYTRVAHIPAATIRTRWQKPPLGRRGSISR